MVNISFFLDHFTHLSLASGRTGVGGVVPLRCLHIKFSSFPNSYLRPGQTGGRVSVMEGYQLVMRGSGAAHKSELPGKISFIRDEFWMEHLSLLLSIKFTRLNSY